MRTQSGSSLKVVILFVLVCLRGASMSAASDPEALVGAPERIQFEPEVQRAVSAMLELSPTFRQQYQRLLDAPVILTARVTPSGFDGTLRARSTIRRYRSGLIVVRMEIGPGSDMELWIAHEFEHVVEQLDGVDVHKAAVRGIGSWFSRGNAVETIRAVNAGRVVLREMRRGENRSDKLVQPTR